MIVAFLFFFLFNFTTAELLSNCTESNDCVNTNENCGQTCDVGVCTEGLNCTNDPLKIYCGPTNVCEECLNASHCLNNFTCQSGVCMCVSNEDCNILGKKLCKEGVCYDCGTSVDCRTDIHCNSTCVDSTCIESNLDCTQQNKFCNAKSAQCVECVTNTTCEQNNPSKPYCSLSSVCVQCISDQNCPQESSYCHLSQCVACVDSEKCRSDEHCNSYCNQYVCHLGDLNCTENEINRVCNKKSGECVQCLSEDDCPNEQRFCSSSGYCLECLTSSDCPSNRKICTQEGNCIACINDIDCRSNNTCDATCQNNTCVIGVKNCTSNPIEKKCDIQTGECHECFASGDCLNKDKNHPFCSPSTLRCVQCLKPDNCRTDSNCNPICNGNCSFGTLNCTAMPNRPRCLVKSGMMECVQCLGNSDCAPPTAICQNHVCIECIADDSCPSKRPFCIENVCKECKENETCRTSASCDSTCQNNQCIPGSLNCLNNNMKYCNQTTGTCLECRYNSDCSVNLDGSPGLCQDHLCVQCFQGQSYQCRTDNNCNSTCVNNRCEHGGLVCDTLCDIHTGNCVECTDDSNCKNHQKPHCDLKQFKCMACIQNTHCIDNNNCGAECVRATDKTDAYCKNDTGSDCGKNGQFCNPNDIKCVQCLKDDHCSALTGCYENECTMSFQKSWWIFIIGGLGLLLFIIGFSCVFIMKYNQSKIEYENLIVINEDDDDDNSV